MANRNNDTKNNSNSITRHKHLLFTIGLSLCLLTGCGSSPGAAEGNASAGAVSNAADAAGTWEDGASPAAEGATGADPGATGADPGATGADLGATGADPSATGADPGASGANPDATGTDPNSAWEDSTTPAPPHPMVATREIFTPKPNDFDDLILYIRKTAITSTLMR